MNAARGKAKRTKITGRTPEDWLKQGRPDWMTGDYDKDVKRPFIAGMRGFSYSTKAYKPPAAPNRHSLSKVEDAKAKFVPRDFYKEAPAALAASDVKQVSSYMLKDGTEYVQGASFPTFVKPNTWTVLQAERAPEAPPKDDEGFSQYIAKKQGLSVVAPKQGAPMDKDFVADRGALLLLLEFVNEVFTPDMKRKAIDKVPIDLVKVSKVPGSKGLYLEKVFHATTIQAGRTSYLGAWKRSERSDKPSYFPAFHRACTGDKDTRRMSVTGIWQVAGSVDGIPDPAYRFVEYSLGGCDMLVRTPSHMVSEGKNVELQMASYHYRQKVTLFDTYCKLVLGGTDQACIALHRTGKIQELLQLTVDKILGQNPAVAEVADKRFGRVAALLKKVKEAMADVPEGEEYVLQWQRGKLVLGKYKLPEKKEVPKEEEKEEELNLA